VPPLTQETVRHRVCLLYDAENIGGGAVRAAEVISALNAAGLDVVSAAATCQSRSLSELSKVLPLHAAALSGGAPAGKEREDILLAVASGYFYSQASVQPARFEGIVLASEDKLLSMCLLPWLRSSIPAYILGVKEFPIDPSLEHLGVKVLILSNYRRKKPAPLEPVFRPEYEIYTFSDVTPPVAGLRVLATSAQRSPVPQFIAFPTVVEEVTIGAQPELCNLPLEYWMNRPGELYSPHAFFGCTTNGWHVRSAKGRRTHTKAVRVNGRAVDASAGNVPLKGGDIIEIGSFKFGFACPPRTSVGHVSEMAKDYELLAAVEQQIHSFVMTVLENANTDWWTDLIPEQIRSRCIERAAGEGENEHPFRFTQLPDLQKILLANWDIFRGGPLAVLWHSKGQVRTSFDCMIRLRNRTMHPTRGGAADTDRPFLERLYLGVKQVLPWPSAVQV
jgi:hypothetical protein